MSTFDERPPYKKRIVSASLTDEQRIEFDALKAALGIGTDGGLIKRALADLSRVVLPVEHLLPGAEHLLAAPPVDGPQP